MYLIVVPFLLLLRQANSQAVSVDWGNYCPSVKKNRLLFFIFVPGNTKRKKNTPKRHKILLKRELLKGYRFVFEDKNFLTLSLSSCFSSRSFFYPARNCIPMVVHWASYIKIYIFDLIRTTNILTIDPINVTWLPTAPGWCIEDCSYAL